MQFFQNFVRKIKHNQGLHGIAAKSAAPSETCRSVGDKEEWAQT